MKGSILLVLLALGLVAVSALQFEDLLNDQLDRPAKRQDSGSDSGEDSDESSGEGEIPYPNHRRNMCMSLMHREFKDYYNPIDVHAINKFMTTAKAQTGAVTNEASAAVAAAEAVPAAGASVAQVMFDRIHAFESNTRATVQKQIGRLLGGLQRGLGFILYDGVHGFDDSRQCSTLNDLFVATFKAFKEANMTKEEATEAFGQDTALHASLSSALLDDIKCLEQDVQRVAADLSNFNNATSSTPSRQVVMQAFGYLYDFSNLVRHFREILCEGQIAAFKIKQATYEGSGSGSGQGGNQGSGSGQGGNQGSGSGQGGNQGSGSGQGGNQGSGSGQGGRGGKGGRGGRGGKGPRGAADKRAAEIKLLTLLLRAMDNQ